MSHEKAVSVMPHFSHLVTWNSPLTLQNKLWQSKERKSETEAAV